MVVVTVPIDKTVDVIRQLPKLPDDCILTDLTSIKQEPLDAMLTAHDGPVVGVAPNVRTGCEKSREAGDCGV